VDECQLGGKRLLLAEEQLSGKQGGLPVAELLQVGQEEV
jgi:hypothetical protein